MSDQWKAMSKALTSAGHSLIAVQENLIDVVWVDRPQRPSTQLRTLGSDYTGLFNEYTLLPPFAGNKDRALA